MNRAKCIDKNRYDYLTVGKIYEVIPNRDPHLMIVIDDIAKVFAYPAKLFEEVVPVITSNTKDTNPKDAVGIHKVPMSTISAPVLMEVGLGMLEGARKYGRHNYRVAGARASVYYDAAMRHLMDYWEGVDTDPDSGISHISKAIATLVVLRDAEINGQLVDDRPPKSKSGWMQELNAKASAIIDKYSDAKEPITELNKDVP